MIESNKIALNDQTFRYYENYLLELLNEGKESIQNEINIHSDLASEGKVEFDAIDYFLYFGKFYQTEKKIIHKIAYWRNKNSEVANEFSSMLEFWEDYEKQTHGNSTKTIWDTYENGARRQIESMLAKYYGSEDTIMLNSGMSGIAVCIEALVPEYGSQIITGQRSYFETSQYLEDFIARRGVDIHRLTNKSSFITNSNSIFLLETVTNEPGLFTIGNVIQMMEAMPTSVFIIDNSVQSHLTKWFDIIPPEQHDRLIVIESGVKYLTENCMLGIVYGNKKLINKLRNYARLTGHQIQQKAFSYLMKSDLIYLENKLKIHSDNTLLFMSKLKVSEGFFDILYSLNSKDEENPIFKNGIGCLIFLRIRNMKDDINISKIHYLAIELWKNNLMKVGLNVHIRAGYGWKKTSARCYSSSQLNQKDAPEYIRISVGVEPSKIIELYADSLISAIEETIYNQIK